MKKTISQAYEHGLKWGKRLGPGLAQQMEATFGGWRAGHPASAHLDYTQELLALDRLRLSSAPSLARFPETKGWPDLIAAKRKGFQEGSGCGEKELAFQFTSTFFYNCRLNTRYVGSLVGTGNCTAVFIRDSREGGPLYGRNWDVPNAPGTEVAPPRRGPDGIPRLWCKGVSCATMCDDEPTEIFPIGAWEVLPDDCRKLADVVEFMERYVNFWQAHNGIIVDADLDCVAYEKGNSTIAWRYSDNGTAAVTACAQLIPAMKEHRERCHARSLQVRGLDHTSADWKYWTGAEQRYHRLLQLVDQAAKKGPTLADMAAIVTDHAVPYPARVCIAGEICHPTLPAGSGEWTMRSRAAVLYGPNRRTLFYRVEGDKACYESEPFLILGQGVSMRDEWRIGARSAPPAATPDDEMENYRQYEFDYPNEYPIL